MHVSFKIDKLFSLVLKLRKRKKKRIKILNGDRGFWLGLHYKRQETGNYGNLEIKHAFERNEFLTRNQ